MDSRIPKRERLMNLVSALLAAEEPVSFREIVGQVIGYDDPGGDEALEKRFDRDKADLRRLGIPIDYMAPDDGSKVGYIVRRDQVFQQKVTFTPQESLLLAIAGRIGAAATGGGALEDALKGALRKLAVDLEDADPNPEMAEIAVLRCRSGDPAALQNVVILARAVTQNRRVRFSYDGPRSERSGPREVDPYGLGLLRGVWYLAGWCHGRSAIRIFKVSRIAGKVFLCGTDERPETFTVPASFRLDDHLGREAWDFGGGAPVTVRLLADPRFVTAGNLPGARSAGVRDGKLVLEIEVRLLRALVPWVLSQQGLVSVIEPVTLREEVAAAARRLLEAYDGQVREPSELEAQVSGGDAR
jgi:proteasome accessory factor B